MAKYLLLFILFFSTASSEEARIEGFESFQDPNMIKTAPKVDSRGPANFGGERQYSDETEAKFCYGDCEKKNTIEKKPESILNIFQ